MPTFLHRHRAPLLSLFLTLCLTYPLRGQQSADPPHTQVVNGVVVSEAGSPIPGVSVQAASGRQTTTGENGAFTIGVSVFPAELSFSGFGLQTRAIRLEGPPLGTMQVVLASEAIALSPLEVLLERTRLVGDPSTGIATPGSAHLLTRQDMNALANPHGNVHHVLRLVPGVNVQEEDGFGLRPNIGLRGSGTERSSKVTLMEDGVLIAPAPYAAPAAYYFPTVARMSAVEVRKGSSQIRFGPRTVGGAINLVSTPVPERRAWEVEGAGGGEGTFRSLARVGGRNGALGWLAETAHLGSDGFKRLPVDRGTGFRTSDYLIKLDLRSALDAEWFHQGEVKLSRTDHESDETYLGLTDPDFSTHPLTRYAASSLDRMTGRHSQIQTRYFVRAPRLFDFTLTAYRNGFRRSWYKLQSVNGTSLADVLKEPREFPSELAVLKGEDSEVASLALRANNRSYVSRGLEGVAALRAGGTVSHTAQLGVRFHRDHEDRLQFEDAYRMVAGRLEFAAGGLPGSQANRLNAARARSVFVQDEIRFRDLAVVAGIRHEHVNLERTDWRSDDPERQTDPRSRRASHVSAWIPGIGATWSPNRNLAVFGGVHRGFAPPGPGADERTKPELGVNRELGVRFRNAGWSLEVTGFLSDHTNVLGQATLASGGDGSGDLFNGGEVRTTGIESVASVNLAPVLGFRGAAPVRVIYTWTRSRFQTGFDSDFEPWGTVEAGDHLPYLSPHQLGVALGWVTSGWDVNATLTAAAAMRAEASQGPVSPLGRTDGVTTIGVRGSVAAGTYARFTWAVENLTDSRYIVSRRPAGVRPNVPRTVLLGVRLRGGTVGF